MNNENIMVENTEVTLSFEASIDRLEQLVRALEQKDIPLEEALNLFRSGIVLVQRCTNLLDHAEKQMEILLDGGDGNLRVEPARFASEG